MGSHGEGEAEKEDKDDKAAENEEDSVEDAGDREGDSEDNEVVQTESDCHLRAPAQD